jgi:hypothetical protein
MSSISILNQIIDDQEGFYRIRVRAPLEIIATNHPLPEIETVWHPEKIDVLSLKQTKCHRSNVHEVLYGDIPAVSKIAVFG